MNQVTRRVTYASVIGAVIAEERELRGVTQAAIAGAAGMPQSTWGRLELGRACTLENLAKVSKVLKVELWQLIRVADDRVKSLESQGLVVVHENPSDEEMQSEPDGWLIGSAVISRASLVGLGAVAGATAVAGIVDYISKLFGDQKK